MSDQWLQAFHRIRNVCRKVSYPGLKVVFGSARAVGQDMPDLWLRVGCPKGVCTLTGAPLPWKGRPWRLSYHMTDGEVVQTAFKAIMTALEHEARESFRYKGAQVFSPHFDIEELVELAQKPGAIQERGDTR